MDGNDLTRDAIDLTTSYLGMTLANPLVASPSPLTGTLDGIRAVAAAGVGAIVLPSVLEESIWRDASTRLHGTVGGIGSMQRVSAQPPAAAVHVDDAGDTLTLLREATATVDVPIIASINGGEAGGWPAYAHALQQAGAHAIELNIFEVPVDADASARAIEARHVELLQTVKSVVTIPVAVKLAPWLTAPAELGMRLIEAGADGLVLFNRFMQPDVDIARMTIVAQPQLSSPWEARMPMAWIAVLRGRTQASLAATTGVAGTADVVKFLLAGADVVMTASALLRNGPAFAATMLGGLRDWMVGAGEVSVAELRGRLHRELGESSVEKRAGYIAFRAEGAREYL
jgi:dihydroorotate dehydrogenase (fumarate)